MFVFLSFWCLLKVDLSTKWFFFTICFFRSTPTFPAWIIFFNLDTNWIFINFIFFWVLPIKLMNISNSCHSSTLKKLSIQCFKFLEFSVWRHMQLLFTYSRHNHSQRSDYTNCSIRLNSTQLLTSHCFNPLFRTPFMSVAAFPLNSLIDCLLQNDRFAPFFCDNR